MPATKNTPSMHQSWRRNVSTSMVGLKKGHICKDLTKNCEPQRSNWELSRRSVQIQLGSVAAIHVWCVLGTVLYLEIRRHDWALIFSLSVTVMLEVYNVAHFFFFFFPCSSYSSSFAFPARSLGYTNLGEIFAYVTVFILQNHRDSHIPSSWMVMVHAGCVFVVSIHPSVTWMSGSFESLQWHACVHRLQLGLYSHPYSLVYTLIRTAWFILSSVQLGLYSHPYSLVYTLICTAWFILSSKRVLGNGVRTYVDSKGKILSTEGSEEVQTCVAASRRTASPTHYQLSCSGPTGTVVDLIVY